MPDPYPKGHQGRTFFFNFSNPIMGFRDTTTLAVPCQENNANNQFPTNDSGS
jgi:hypothetical protein